MRWDAIDAAISPYTQTSLIALTQAALDSPTAGHRSTSLALLRARVFSKPPEGREPAAAGDLELLLRAARRTHSAVPWFEDFWHSNPLLDVRWPINGARLRIHPGAVLDPLGVLDRLHRVARAIDEPCRDAHGFAFSDLVELGVRIGQATIQALEPHWPSSVHAPPGVTDPELSALQVAESVASHPALVTQQEIDAVAAFVDSGLLDQIVSECAAPDAAAAALRWATLPGSALNLRRWTHRETRELAVEVEDRYIPCPASAILPALSLSADVLGKEFSSSPESRARYAAEACLQTARDLVLPDRDFVGELAFGAGVAVTSRRRAALLVAAQLDGSRLDEHISAAVELVSRIPRDQIVEPDADLASSEPEPLRVVLVESPWRIRWSFRQDALVAPAAEVGLVFRDSMDSGLGRYEAWRFLFDLAERCRSATVESPDFLDCWRDWQQHGGFGPPTHLPEDLQGSLIRTNWLLFDPTWEVAARWEPIDHILEAAGLPPSRVWLLREIDVSDRATVWAPPDVASGILGYRISTDGLIVGSDAPFEREDEGDPYTPHFLAAAIFDAIVARPGVVDSLRLSRDKPLALKIDIDREQSDPISYAVGHEGVAHIRVGWSMSALLLEDPATGHRALGDVLAHIARGRGAFNEAEFASAWSAGFPFMITTRARSRPERSLRRTIVLSRASMVRAHQAARRAADDRGGLGTEVLSGDEAASRCERTVLPATQDALRIALTAFDRDLLIRRLTQLHDETLAHRMHVRRQRDLALTAPWREEAIRTLDDYDDDVGDVGLAIQALLEAAIAADTSATGVVADEFDVADLVALSMLLLRAGLLLDGYRRGLNSLTVCVLGGALLVSDERTSIPAAPDIDMDGYRQAVESESLAVAIGTTSLDHPLDQESKQQSSEGAHVFTRLAAEKAVPGRLLAVNRELMRVFGTGVDGLAAVLGVAADMPSPGWTGDIAVTTADALATEATEWSGCDRAEIDAAVGLLTLNQQVASTDAQAWPDVERRTARLTIRPLVEVESGLLALPNIVGLAQDVIGIRLAEGRSPWPYADEGLRVALDEYRQLVNRSLEREVEEILTRSGLAFATRVEESDVRIVGVEGPWSEVDAIALDSANQLMWVIEVKDIHLGISPREIKGRVNKYTKPGGYLSKLRKKASKVASHIDDISRMLGHDAPGSVEVRPLFVTRRVEPSAFVRRPLAAYVTVDGLAQLLREPTVYRLGFNAMPLRAAH